MSIITDEKRPGGSGNFPEPQIQQFPTRKTDMHTNSTISPDTASNLWSVLDEAHIMLLEAYDLTELLHMAAERLGSTEVGPFQRGADTILRRIAGAKDTIEGAMHDLRGGTA